MEKILLFGDPGIDDSLAIIYGLLHPELEIVGIVTSFGNVTQEQTEQNAAYLLSLAGREDIPLISGAKYPLSGESVTFYPEIHGPDGLGPIRPPDNIFPNILNFDEVFTIIEKYKNELIIVDVGRSSSLAISFILGGDIMNKVKAFYLMGGAFLVPGNVTAQAEANFYGDPIATNLVVERGRNVTIIPLNVTNEAIVTPKVIDFISRKSANPFSILIEPIFDYYFEAYKKNVPGIQGAPIHDVVTLSAIVNPMLIEYTSRRVTIELFGEAKGESLADFRPTPNLESFPTLDRIGMQLNYQLFLQDFINIMTKKM